MIITNDEMANLIAVHIYLLKYNTSVTRVFLIFGSIYKFLVSDFHSAWNINRWSSLINFTSSLIGNSTFQIMNICFAAHVDSWHLAPVVQRLDNAIERTSVNKTNHAICWIAVYPVYSVIQSLNNQGLVLSIKFWCCWTFSITIHLVVLQKFDLN